MYICTSDYTKLSHSYSLSFISIHDTHFVKYFPNIESNETASSDGLPGLFEWSYFTDSPVVCNDTVSELDKLFSISGFGIAHLRCRGSIKLNKFDQVLTKTILDAGIHVEDKEVSIAVMN